MEFYDLPVLNTLFFTRKFDEKTENVIWKIIQTEVHQGQVLGH